MGQENGCGGLTGPVKRKAYQAVGKDQSVTGRGRSFTAVP